MPRLSAFAPPPVKRHGSPSASRVKAFHFAKKQKLSVLGLWPCRVKGALMIVSALLGGDPKPKGHASKRAARKSYLYRDMTRTLDGPASVADVTLDST
jgi:hypothetical protein